MDLKFYETKRKGKVSNIPIGEYCNLLPSFMKDYNSYNLEENSDFTKEQYIDLINKKIDIRVKRKARPTYDDLELKENWWSYFRIEWYDDDKMYNFFLPDKHLKIVRYIEEGDIVILNPHRIESILDSYRLEDDTEEDINNKEKYKKWAKNKTQFKVKQVYDNVDPIYNLFSNVWCVLNSKDIDHDIYLPDWVLIKPVYSGKKPIIRNIHNF
jgi:hypothetical protein